MDKKLREAGPELFDSSEIVRITPEDFARERAQFKSAGAKLADGVTDQIMAAAKNVIKRKAQRVNFDLEAAAEAAGMSVDEYIDDGDDMMELTMTLADDYLLGMEDAWFGAIISI